MKAYLMQFNRFYLTGNLGAVLVLISFLLPPQKKNLK